MNVFHLVLTKIYQISGGKESVDVDLIDLLKKEGFYSNIDQISKQLQDEGWIAETTPRYTVRITHWGVGEAKRVLSDSPDKANEFEKLASKFLSECRELMVMVEEFNSKPDGDKLKLIDDRLDLLKGRSKALSSLI